MQEIQLLYNLRAPLAYSLLIRSHVGEFFSAAKVVPILPLMLSQIMSQFSPRTAGIVVDFAHSYSARSGQREASKSVGIANESSQR